jgi:hypothetical protein
MLIIAKNFALNNQVDYYRLEVPHLKLKPTLRQRGNFTFHLYQYVPCTLRAIRARTVTPANTVALCLSSESTTLGRGMVYGRRGHVIGTSNG